MSTMSERTVYLMRGLPSCGKSFTARRLVGEEGIVLETDEYFYLLVGDDPASYDYDEKRLPAAQRWNFDRFTRAIAQKISPIVVDRGNGLNRETQRYALHAVENGYRVVLQEPESDWWLVIRELLRDKESNDRQLSEWAERLAERSRATHRVPSATIYRWMKAWKPDLTVDEILEYESPE
jgi:hypothetical protein